MNMDMMKTEGTLYRPPLEAKTFLLQVTAGCTHNKCRFCNMYRDKSFHMIDEDIVRYNLREGKRVADIYQRPVQRIFLMDGDVFSLSADRLEEKVKLIRQYMPQIETFTMYAAVRSIQTKTDDELLKLRALGVNDLYIGYETGLDDVLSKMNKGSDLADSITQAERLNRAGINHNALMILGLAGKGRGAESGEAAAKLINRIKPKVTRLTTLSVFPGSDLEKDVKEGRFEEAGEKEILTEEKIILENVILDDMYLWASHVLNSTPLAGYMGKDSDRMIKSIEEDIEDMDEELFRKTFRRQHL